MRLSKAETYVLGQIWRLGRCSVGEAAAASLMSRRVSRLIAASPQSCFAANTLLLAVFGAVLFLGVFETVAHTACCFVSR